MDRRELALALCLAASLSCQTSIQPAAFVAPRVSVELGAVSLPIPEWPDVPEPEEPELVALGPSRMSGQEGAFVPGAPPAPGTDYYVCDCYNEGLTDGAETGCTEGTFGASGNSPANAKRTPQEILTLLDSTMQCGDRLLLCEGGAWNWTVTSPATITNNTDCRANLKRITTYDPGAFNNRPRWTKAQGTGNPLIEFGAINTYNASANGYHIENVEVLWVGTVPPTGQEAGIEAGGHLTYLSMDNIHVRGFIMNLWYNAAGAPAQGQAAYSPTIILRNSHIERGYAHGQLGSIGNYSIFDNNDWDHNVTKGCTNNACGGNHAVYFGTHADVVGWQFTRNRVHGSCHANGACQCNVMAVRGGTDYVFTDNVFEEIDEGAGPRDNFTSCNVRFNLNGNLDGSLRGYIARNKFHGIDYVGLCGMQDSIIENNEFVIFNQPSGSSVSGGKIGLQLSDHSQQHACNGGPTDLDTNNVTVRNNSVWIDQGNGSKCYDIRNTQGTSHEAHGNVCHLTANAPNSRCFDGITPEIWDLDYNVCRQDSTGTYGNELIEWIFGQSPITVNHTLASWQTMLGGCPNAGNDCNSLEDSDPLFMDVTLPGLSLDIPLGSPARDIAPGSEAALFSTEDFEQVSRPQGTNFDAGAYEYH